MKRPIFTFGLMPIVWHSLQDTLYLLFTHIIPIGLLVLALNTKAVFANEANEAEHAHHDEEPVSLTLSQMQKKHGNIAVRTLSFEPLTHSFTAVGEVKSNGYKSYIVSSRTDSVIMKRHVSLGDHVDEGQALVTLFSESIAQSQAEYLVNSATWHRIRQLPVGTVSDSEQFSARTQFNASLGKLKALGLSDKIIEQLNNGKMTDLGLFTLTAEQSGVVANDDFSQGQRVAAGDKIMVLSDERELWVEARFAPSISTGIAKGMQATVLYDSKQFPAIVIQESHTIDPITRTKVIRLNVNNQSHQLHGGLFVDVVFRVQSQDKKLLVPRGALTRAADGDWQLMVETEQGMFIRQEVEYVEAFADRVEISGLAPGVRYAGSGAFFIASEFAKANFDTHNH
ncbi:hypothetical protein PULV_b0716 [Pseudoalteromonas ulvae UL12]|uniref:efflux RND transporter periplasmic adaptor subunit n=1 Tax=Pseudoalteromonas ulvae TaxID=107327 RepID=UPI00186B6912|nr:efflux RND transporter periplasmic adaptor subunit [Pseudoalteromonas ulvae]MBE0365994.1 hypothetical protein [Pseudoalteromonas ulvae UL12]